MLAWKDSGGNNDGCGLDDYQEISTFDRAPG